MKKSNNKLLGAGVLTAIASSLCCITPVLAVIAGSSGLASTFSWLEPARPYLIGLTVLVLGFAWYQKLKPRSREEIECECDTDESPSFWQSRKFLIIVTVFALVMTAFPYYSQAIFPSGNEKTVNMPTDSFNKINIPIEGMTCSGCEETINYYVKELPGVIKVNANYQNGNAIIEYDSSKTKYNEIVKAINKTGYKVK